MMKSNKYGMKRFLVVAALLVLFAGMGAAQVRQQDGFEDGDFTNDPVWSDDDENPGSTGVFGNIVKEGSFAANLNVTPGMTDGTQVLHDRGSSDSISDGHKYVFWLRSNTSGTRIGYGLHNTDTGDEGFYQDDDGIGVDFNGNIRFVEYDGTGGFSSTTTLVSGADTDTWYNVSMEFDVTNSEVDGKVWHENGTLMGTATSSYSGASNIQYVSMVAGQVSDGLGAGYFDDVSYSTQIDNDAPTIDANTTRPSPSNIQTGDSVDTVVNATDPDGDTMKGWVTVNEDGTDIVTDKAMSQPATGDFQDLDTFTADQTNTWYNLTYTVGDGTANTTSNLHFKTPANQPPTVENGTVEPDPSDAGTQVNITFDVQDPEGDPLSYVTVNLTAPNSTQTVDNESMTDLGGGLHQFLYTTPFDSGSIGDWSANATASDGTATGTNGTFFTVQDNDKPLWSNLRDNATGGVEVDEPVNISVKWRDVLSSFTESRLATNETGAFKNYTEQVDTTFTIDTVNELNSVVPTSQLLRGVHISPSGNLMHLIGDGQSEQYRLSDPYNVSSETLENGSTSLGSGDSITFNNDGTIVYKGTSQIVQRKVSEPYNLSTITGGPETFNPSVLDNDANGIAWNNDGTKFYIGEVVDNDLHQFSVSDPYNISTASYQKTEGVKNGESIGGISWDDTGEILFVSNEGLAGTGGLISQYGTTVDYDISTISLEKDNNVNNEVDGVEFNGTGSFLYIVARDDSEVIQYNVSETFKTYLSPNEFSTNPNETVLSNFTWKNSSFDGELGYRVWGLDGSNNWNLTDTQSFTVNPPDPPNFTDENPVDDSQVGFPDRDINHSVKVNYSLDGTLDFFHNGTYIGDAQQSFSSRVTFFSYFFDNKIPIGIHNWTVQLTDGDGRQYNSSLYNYSVAPPGADFNLIQPDDKEKFISTNPVDVITAGEVTPEAGGTARLKVDGNVVDSTSVDKGQTVLLNETETYDLNSYNWFLEFEPNSSFNGANTNKSQTRTFTVGKSNNIVFAFWQSLVKFLSDAFNLDFLTTEEKAVIGLIIMILVAAAIGVIAGSSSAAVVAVFATGIALTATGFFPEWIALAFIILAGLVLATILFLWGGS